MKKIAAIIAATVVATSANAGFVTSFQGGLTSSSMKESFSNSLTNLVASGNYSATIETTGTTFNGGEISFANGTNINGAGGGYTFDVTYTNATFNLGSATGVLVNNAYGGTAGIWLTRYDFGYSLDNTLVWAAKGAITAPKAVTDTNGSYIGTANGNNTAGGNGLIGQGNQSGIGAGATPANTGSLSCVGTGCGLFEPASYGIEGLSIYMVVNSNAGFALLDNWIVVQDIQGTNGSSAFQFTTNGTASAYTPPAAVPVPAAAWLMGSGLVGLAGIARRRKMA